MVIIYKYPLEIKPGNVIDLPVGAAIMTAQIQNGALQMWAMVNQGAPTERRVFDVWPTGVPLSGYDNEGLQYIETVQIGPLVFHIFERIAERDSRGHAE